MAEKGIVRFIRRLADPLAYAGATDRELLKRFLDGRDEAAFEALFRRHARLVRSAIARVLSDPNDADDATQATFLVLVQHARRMNWRSGLGPWLYGVAHRVAVKLRARKRRQAGPLGPADPADPSPPPDLSWREACDLLHAELDRLPDRYRLPLLLCYLEGKTREEAADALGVSLGTVKGQVRRGCELLRRRLARRGVTLSAGLFGAVAASRVAGAAGPTAVLAAVLGTPSPRVAELAREVAMGTGVSRLVKGLLAGLLLAGVGVALLGLAVGPEPLTGRLVPTAGARGAPAPEQPAPATFLVQDRELAFLGPDGRVKERLGQSTHNGALSPDGRRLAYLEFDKEAARSKLVIRQRDGAGEPVTIQMVYGMPGISGALPVWDADGRRLLIGEVLGGGDGMRVNRVYDLREKTISEVKLPDGCWVTDWSRDGKQFLVTARQDGTGMRVGWLSADGTGTADFLTPEDEFASTARLSPDGRRMLYQAGPKPPKGERVRWRLYVMDLATKKRVAVDEPGETHGYCWSPDGSRVAYTWQRSLDKPEEVPERETLLITCDPDGGNRKTVTSRKYEVPENSSGRSAVVNFFWVVDWR